MTDRTKMQMKLFIILLPLIFTGLSANADTPPPETTTLVASNSYTFSYSAEVLEGPAAQLIRDATTSSQFVLLGEEHMDHNIPIFAGALFRLLRETHGFHTLVVEQDPVAIVDALSPERRGVVGQLAAYSARYPFLYEFDTDEDLSLLADVALLESGPNAIWGVEQATSATRALEELATLAPDDQVRVKTELLAEIARQSERQTDYSAFWLIAADTPGELTSLTEAFRARPDSRAAQLISGLSRSAEIYSYYRRAEAGEFVGLYNNTVREALMKEQFIRRYRSASLDGMLPKAMFKFGSNHLYHGKNPTQAFPIGNLAHELAIVNGMDAYGISVYAFGDGYQSYKDLPEWLLPVLPSVEPSVPTLIDLRALRPYQRLFRLKVAELDQWMVRDLMNGYDAIVLLPGSRPGERNLGGRNGSR